MITNKHLIKGIFFGMLAAAVTGCSDSKFASDGTQTPFSRELVALQQSTEDEAALGLVESDGGSGIPAEEEIEVLPEDLNNGLGEDVVVDETVNGMGNGNGNGNNGNGNGNNVVGETDPNATDDPTNETTNEVTAEQQVTSETEGPRNFICILEGPGKSIRLGLASGGPAGQHPIPQVICMSQEACLIEVARAFDVKMAHRRGFCPDKNPNVHSMTYDEIKTMIDAL